MAVYADRTDLARHGANALILAQISTTEQDEVLESMSAVADDYLRERFPLPLTTWSRSLRAHVAAMAAYELLSVRGYNIDSSDKILKERFEAALRWLERCTLGQLTPQGTLGTVSEEDDGEAVHGGAAVASSPRRRPLR
ncbi:MAG: DUF1320 family protein [Deltaproteobacteria bacterium]|nr:DUF1320 family protein [Myxococcales bacterium]MDP3217690.1 DUF1320 family protein [Deltaproteobacteria bacterium]